MGVVGGAPFQHLTHGEELLDGGLLEHDPDALEHPPAVVAGVEAEHGDLARGRCLVALEDLDDRGLAGAVRPEQGEDLAALHFEVDASHGLDGAEVLAQPVYRHSQVHGGKATQAGPRPGSPPVV